MIKIAIKYAFPLLCGIMFCLPAGLSAQKIEYDKGVKIIHNEKPRYKSDAGVKLKYVRTIGDLYSDDENFLFFHPEDILLDSKGNMLILDAGNKRIQKFDSKAQYIKTIGREGQGPGEFADPVAIDIARGGNIIVMDAGNHRFEILSAAGEPLKTIRLTSAFNNFRILKNDNLLLSRSGGIFFDEGAIINNKTMPLFLIQDQDGSEISKFGESTDFGSEFTNASANGILFEIDESDNKYVSFVNQNRIEKYGLDGKLLFTMDRKLNYDTKIEQDNIERLPGGVLKGTTSKKNKVSSGIAVDKNGRIWVSTFSRQLKKNEASGRGTRVDGNKIYHVFEGNSESIKTDVFKLEVFDNNGLLLKSIPLDHFCDKIRIFGGRLFIIDRNRGMQIYEYSIVE